MSSSSKSQGFTAEELAALMPWRLPVVGEPDVDAIEPEPESAVTVVEEEVESIAMPTAEEIEAMQQQAREEAAEQGYREGYERGLQEGYQAGRKNGYDDGQAAVEKQIACFKDLADGLAEPLKSVDRQVEAELVSLVVALAKQLIRRELKTDQGQIVAVIREAIAVLPSSSRVVNLHLHPDDIDIVRDVLPMDESGQRWRLIDDPLLTRGGCRITSETSQIDATVEKRIASAVAQAFGGDRDEDG